MKVLFFTNSRKKAFDKGFYGGGGWMQSLMFELEKSKLMEFADAFFYDTAEEPWLEGNIRNIPMFKKQKNKLDKLYYYWIGYKHVSYDEDVSLMLDVIKDYNPDIIHVFGTERSFSSIQNHVNIPVVIYLQGLLNPYYNAYYPPGVNKWSFLIGNFSNNEMILNNGYNANYKFMKYGAIRELIHLKNARHVIGRTTWDYEVSRLLSPASSYYFLNDMLRSEFYVASPWNKTTKDKYIIYSTISNVTYKGLDLVLKTAQNLKLYTNISFEWHIAGITIENKIVKFYEKELSIDSTDTSIKYVGVRSANQLIEDLQKSDVYVHPSHIDNAPNSLCEAQILGLPVIACHVGGVGSLIKDGITGILIPPNAPYKLAYLIKEDATNNTLKSLSHPARLEALKRHDKSRIINDLHKIYETVLNIKPVQYAKDKTAKYIPSN